MPPEVCRFPAMLARAHGLAIRPRGVTTSEPVDPGAARVSGA